jgi:glucosamine-6-phosphate deaminase
MRVIACETGAAVAERCADVVAEVLREKPDPVLVFPAGGTPRLFFEELVRRWREGEINLRSAHIFQLDEMVGVSAGHPASFHRFLRETLLDPLDHPEERTHLLDGMAPSPAGVIEKHAETLAALGGADLSVLGIGLNGHVAFNEPGSTLETPAGLVSLSPATLGVLRKSFPADKTPKWGLTLGLQELVASRRICLLATGESKADVLFAMLSDSPSSQLPASLLRDHEALTILADAPARDRFQFTN